ncbi:hypothetical protein PMAYCL1PPCAC_21838, partial [Pristionchus mayeri]
DCDQKMDKIEGCDVAAFTPLVDSKPMTCPDGKHLFYQVRDWAQHATEKTLKCDNRIGRWMVGELVDFAKDDRVVCA